MENKDFGFCCHCGDRIESFKWALTDWLCAYCYYAMFPNAREPEEPTGLSGLFNSHIPGQESYEFLKEHLHSQPHCYERSFRTLRPFVLLLQCFETLKELLDYIAGEYDKTIRSCLKNDLKEALAKYPYLFPEVVEILTFVLWDEMVDEYGRGERFPDGYWDLICELESCYRDTEVTEAKK